MEEEVFGHLKEEMNNKIQVLFSNINSIEDAIEDAIEEAVYNSDKSITTTEISSALLNVLKKFNQKEIMEIIKNV